MKLRNLIIFSACIAALTGCDSKNAAEGLSLSSSTGTSTQVKDVKQIVSVGPGLNFNGQTGSWSEMAMDPVSHNPGVVYYDRTTQVSPVAGAMKYAAMDAAGNWNIEVVDANAGTSIQACAGGATSASCIGAPNVATVPQPAQVYDLKYLTTPTVASGQTLVTSRPVIAYVYGTGAAGSSVTGKSIRLAEKAADGTWSVATPVTGAFIFAQTTNVGPMLTGGIEYSVKGVRLLVDDSNRIHLWFAVYSATPNNSFFGYVMRKADGTWLTPVAISTTIAPTVGAFNFVTAAPTLAIANAGMQQAGAAWCKYATGGTSADATGAVLALSTTSNTPTATGSSKQFLMKCATANADGSCASWQGLDFHNSCVGTQCVTTAPIISTATSNVGGRSDIAIDPTTGKIFLSTFFAAPTLTGTPVALASGILSTQSAAACDALSTANWATVRGHPTLAQGTLGFRNAADGTSFFLASLTGALGTAYTVNKLPVALAANWDIVTNINTVESTTNTVAGGFAYDATTSALWGSYGAFTAAAAGAAGQDLKVFNAYTGDIINTGIVNNMYVDQTNFITQNTAIPLMDAAVATNGTVGYAYFYQEAGTAGPNSHLYYGVRGNTALSPVFAGQTMVSNSIVGATTFTNGTYPSLTYDTLSNPVIAFLDNGIAANTGYLMVARSSNGGASFNLDRVDGSTSAANTVGQYNSAHVSPSNTIGVAYYDFSAGVQRLKFAKREKNGAWRRFIVDGPGSSGTGCALTAGAGTGVYAAFRWTSTGRPVIAYQSNASGIKTLRLAYATEAETSGTYTWTCMNIDTVGQSSSTRGEGIELFLSATDVPHIAHIDLGVGAVRYVTCASNVLTCAATGTSAFIGERLNYIIGTPVAVSTKPAIRVDSAGKVYIAFYSTADQGLYLVSKASGGTWSTAEAIETPVSGASYVSGAGQYAAMVLTSSSKPTIFYRSLENWIKYFSRETY